MKGLEDFLGPKTAHRGGGRVPDGEKRHRPAACLSPENRASGGAPVGVLFKPKNGNEVAWIISQLSAVVLNAGANGVFFNSPTG